MIKYKDKKVFYKVIKIKNNKNMSNYNIMRIAHSYHLVQFSPWPLTTGISIMSIMLGNVMIFQNIYLAKELILISLISLSYSLFNWFKDIIIEGTYQGEHTIKVQKGLNLGFILFVISEICVFFALFYSYFYNCLVPSIEVGGIWPPTGIITVDYKAIPLFNTLILLSSGFTITICHNLILHKDYNNSLFYLLFTILLGVVFIYFQYVEYYNSPFTLTDSVYGSSFYILTSCHGLHIIIGTCFLLFTLLRFSHLSSHHHIQFTTSAIYWHFLDAVWLLLYFILYCWAS